MTIRYQVFLTAMRKVDERQGQELSEWQLWDTVEDVSPRGLHDLASKHYKGPRPMFLTLVYQHGDTRKSHEVRMPAGVAPK